MIVVISNMVSHTYVNGALLTYRHTAVSQALGRDWPDGFPTRHILPALTPSG